jgi:hypothetical protein
VWCYTNEEILPKMGRIFGQQKLVFDGMAQGLKKEGESQ